MDYFRSNVDDRVALSGLFAVTDEIKQALLAAGVPEAHEFTSVRYFTNDFDTRTEGVDVVAGYGWESGLGRPQRRAGVCEGELFDVMSRRGYGAEDTAPRIRR